MPRGGSNLQTARRGFRLQMQRYCKKSICANLFCRLSKKGVRGLVASTLAKAPTWGANNKQITITTDNGAAKVREFMKNQTNNANNVAKASANNVAKATVYNGMYAAIRQQAQSPSQVVKSFYSAAMSLDGGEYADIFAQLLGKSKNDFCATYCKKVVEAFNAQTRCKHYTLFFVWRVVYADIKPIIDEMKRHADYNKNIESLQKEAKAVEALEKAAKAANGAK